MLVSTLAIREAKSLRYSGFVVISNMFFNSASDFSNSFFLLIANRCAAAFKGILSSSSDWMVDGGGSGSGDGGGWSDRSTGSDCFVEEVMHPLS